MQVVRPTWFAGRRGGPLAVDAGVAGADVAGSDGLADGVAVAALLAARAFVGAAVAVGRDVAEDVPAGCAATADLWQARHLSFPKPASLWNLGTWGTPAAPLPWQPRHCVRPAVSCGMGGGPPAALTVVLVEPAGLEVAAGGGRTGLWQARQTSFLRPI